MSNEQEEQEEQEEQPLDPTHPTSILSKFRNAIPESDPIRDARRAAKRQVGERLAELRVASQVTETKRSSLEKARLARLKKVEE